MARLKGRTCLIVGGTGGIGAACARRFAAEGARVAVTGVEVADAQPSTSIDGALPTFSLDCRHAPSVESRFAQAVAQLGGRLDILLHVAGISGRRFGDGPLDECSVEGWDEVMTTNARAVFLTNRAAVSLMRKQEPDSAGLRGTVVNVGSVLAYSPAPELFGTVAYAASKAAIHALTLAAASRYASEKIRFSVLAPGLIDTPMAQRAVSDPRICSYLVTKQPMTEGPGVPDDCAEAALFLCEPASRFVTGVVLEVAGGWSLSEGR